MKRSHTPSFVLTLKLNTSAADERELGTRFTIALRLQNLCITHAKKQLLSMRMDPAWKKASEDYFSGEGNRGKNGRDVLQRLRLTYGLSENQFQSWLKPHQQQVRDRIDSNTGQRIASNVWHAVQTVLFQDGRQLREKEPDEFRSMEGKTNRSGIRFQGGRLVWNGLKIQPRRKKKDVYAEEALTHPIKYCRIVRKKLGERWHYYLQLILEGTPPEKRAAKK